jgi:hypothetical protein
MNKKIISIIIFLFSTGLYGSPAALRPDQEVKYRTSFGQCPSRAAGMLTLQLMKEFEKNLSLKEVKELIVTILFREC